MTGVLELFLVLCAVYTSVCLASDGSQPYLIFPTHHGLSRVDAKGGSNHQMLVNSSQQIHTVDFHWRMGLLFWTDYAGHAVHQAELNGSSQTTVASGVPSPAGLAVDWINDNLYFSFENASANHLIAVYDIQEGGEWDALLECANAVWDIACDPHTQELYWTTGYSIERSSLDGSEVEVLQSFGPLSCAFSIALDTTDKQLFWIDHCNSDHIHMLNLISLIHRVVPTSTATGPLYGLTTYGNVLYWTSAMTNSIISKTVEGGDEEEVFRDSDSTHWRGIRAVHPHVQPRAAPNETILSSSTPLPLPTPEPARTSVVSIMAQSEASSFPVMLMPMSSFMTSFMETTMLQSPSDTSVVTPSTPLITPSRSSPPPSSSVTPTNSSDVDDSEASSPIEYLKKNPVAVGMMAGSILFVISTLVCLCVVVICKRRSRRKYKRRRSTLENTQDLWMVNRHAESSPQGHTNPLFTPSTLNTVSPTQATILVNPHINTPQPSAPPMHLHPLPHGTSQLSPPHPSSKPFRQHQPYPQGHAGGHLSQGHVSGHLSQQPVMPSQHGRTSTHSGQY